MPKRFSSVVGRSFGDGVRAAIQATGMPQRALAEVVDWEEAKLSDLVNGKGGVTEQALRLQVGSPELMIAQLQDLLRMSIRPYISVRVVPLSTGVHAGLAGSFTRLGFEKFEPVVFIETHNLNLFLEDKGSIGVYDEVLKALDGQALDEEQSKELITSLLT